MNIMVKNNNLVNTIHSIHTDANTLIEAPPSWQGTLNVIAGMLI